MYDVWRYDVVMDVDAAKINQIIRQFEVGQWITVLNVQIASVDNAMQAVSGYMYGNKPVVRLSLHCEELFLRSWTDPITPPTRKNGAGAKTSGSGGGNMATPGIPENFGAEPGGGGGMGETRGHRVRNER